MTEGFLLKEQNIFYNICCNAAVKKDLELIWHLKA